MPKEVASVQAEDIRLKNMRTQIENRNRNEVKELQDRLAMETERTITSHTATIQNLRGAYDVQISEEAENLENRLNAVRAANEERVEAEKKAGEAEVAKVKTMTQARVEEYKKIEDEKIAKIKKEVAAQSENLHEKEKRIARNNYIQQKLGKKSGVDIET